MHQWCELLKSPKWLLSCEEKKTSAVRAQVATAHLAKNFSQELPREVVMDKNRNKTMGSTGSPWQLNIPQSSSCTIAVLSLLGIVGAVFTLQRSKTDGNFISPGMHMPSQPLVSCFLSSLTFLSCPTHFLSCISVGKRPYLWGRGHFGPQPSHLS